MIELLSNKWLSLFCTLINSVFASFAWQQGEYGLAAFSFVFAFICGHNFMVAVKEDYYDKNRK